MFGYANLRTYSRRSTLYPLVAGIRKSHICHFFFFSFSEQKNPCLLNPCQMNQTCVRKGSGHTVPYECECPPGFYGTFCEKTFTIYANEMTGTWHIFLSIKFLFISIYFWHYGPKQILKYSVTNNRQETLIFIRYVFHHF